MSPELAEAEVGPVWRDCDCGGKLRLEIDDDSAGVILAECDGCGDTVGVPRRMVDPEWLVGWALQRSHLPRDLIGKPWEPKPEGADAVQMLKTWVAGFSREAWGLTDKEATIRFQRVSQLGQLSVEGTIDEVPEAHPPLLVGPPGVGKTHLFTWAATELIRLHAVQVGYWTMNDLLGDAKRLMDRGYSDIAAFAQAASVPVLVLDDLGAERASDWSRSARDQVVDLRYREGLPTLIATNVRPSAWIEEFGDRTASRLLGMSRPILIEGEDWRRR